jgi:23S rRNA (uracil1939-C5)-methyltransferase
MDNMQRNKPVLENLLVTDIAAEGKAIAKYEGMVVFITQAVPGDVVDVQVIRKRKRYMEAFPVRFHKYAGNRAVPFCEHFGQCGGCRWQQLPYAEQLIYKQKQVADNLGRIGKVQVNMINPIIGSEKQTCYRNKLEFTFSHNRWLTPEEIKTGRQYEQRHAVGFHIPGRFDKVLDITRCHLQPEPSNRIRNFVREFAVNQGLDFFNVEDQEGFLRNLTIRNNRVGEFMVIFSFFRDEPDLINLLLHVVEKQFPEIVSLVYVINPKANDTINDLQVRLYNGKDHLEEEMEGLKFRISPKSFFQTNPDQAYRLFCITRDFAALTGKETVYDLYTGTGTIALFLARSCKKITGIDYVPEAVVDAKMNAAENNIANAEFFSGDIRKIFRETFLSHQGRPDVVVTDPPRTGMHQEVVETILYASPRRIVYVSCNPATQARDISLLATRYRVTGIQPLDMFPHTHHVENVVLLELNG